MSKLESKFKIGLGVFALSMLVGLAAQAYLDLRKEQGNTTADLVLCVFTLVMATYAVVSLFDDKSNL